MTLEPLGVPDHMGFPWPLQLLHDSLVGDPWGPHLKLAILKVSLRGTRGTRGTHYPHVPQRNHTIAEQPGPGSVSKDTSRILRTCEAK